LGCKLGLLRQDRLHVQENNLNEIYFYYFFVLKERIKQQAELIVLKSAFVFGGYNFQKWIIPNYNLE
jgi:hypothetical protein